MTVNDNHSRSSDGTKRLRLGDASLVPIRLRHLSRRDTNNPPTELDQPISPLVAAEQDHLSSRHSSSINANLVDARSASSNFEMASDRCSDLFDSFKNTTYLKDLHCR